MITGITIGKSLKLSIGTGYESTEISIQIEADMQEGRENDMTDKEIIDEYTAMAASYLTEEKKKVQGILADKSIFKGGK